MLLGVRTAGSVSTFSIHLPLSLSLFLGLGVVPAVFSRFCLCIGTGDCRREVYM